jgi:hypothetical protein
MAAGHDRYEKMILERQGVDEITALKWAKEQNAKITFLPNGRVCVEVPATDNVSHGAVADTFIGAVLMIVLKEP